MCGIGDRLDTEIPTTQATYQKYRSTAEHNFATKMLVEQPVSVKNETAHRLILDITKTFDNKNRNLLLKNLKDRHWWLACIKILW